MKLIRYRTPYQEREQERKTEKSVWTKVNNFILILHLVCPLWIVALMYTVGITGKIFPVALAAALVVELTYKIVQRYGKGKKLLYAARVISVGTVIAFYMPTALLMNFSHTKELYTLKRLDYLYGVFTSPDYYERLLPPELPEVCEDYSFYADGCMVAQDYHPSSYLVFHTDSETLDSYAEHFDGLECVRYDNGTREIFDDGRDADYVRGRIEWVCGQMARRVTISDNLDHAVLYWFKGMYPQAVLLNYETGLAAIMT